MTASGSSSERCDVLVIGGALAGAATALLLRRWLPERRVIVIEARERFDRKVGEATVEVSGLFLHRVLGLYDHLSREQLPKHGLRFWFTDGGERGLAEMTEVGATELPRTPAFQLDRARLDEHVLALAAAAGCEVLRAARVRAVEGDGRGRTVRVRTAAGERRIAAHWIVDASGREGCLATLWRLRRHEPRHPTVGLWARWSGVADLDGPAVLGPDVRAPRLEHAVGARRLATNHFCGYGFWCWVIPLRGGETSIGLVYDTRLFDPGPDSPRAAYKRFVTQWPGLRDLVKEARMDETDFHMRRRLAYSTERYAGPGFALVGDAASFMDPYYSPGLDHVAVSVYATARLIEDELNGRTADLQARIDDHNRAFARSYERWLNAVYADKYELMGDAELTRTAFLVDTALYYLGIVRPMLHDIEAMAHPPFGQALRQSRYAAAAMALFKRRLVRIARFRRRVGLYGRRNVGWRPRNPAFAPGLAAVKLLLCGLGAWVRLETHYAFHRLWWGAVGVSRPVPDEPGASVASVRQAPGSERGLR